MFSASNRTATHVKYKVQICKIRWVNTRRTFFYRLHSETEEVRNFMSITVVIISLICKVFIELCYTIGVNYYNLLTLMYISLFLLSKQFMFIIKKCFIIQCWIVLCKNTKSDYLVLCINMRYFIRNKSLSLVFC